VKKAILIIAVVFCMFFLISMTATAQDFGDIKGTVQDADGGALPGVTVTLTGSKIVDMNTITSGKGNFRFLKLPVGSDYVLKFELPGFKTHIQENIVVLFGQDVNLVIALEQAALSEEVTVVAQNPVIDTKRARVGVNITEEMIMDLPTARNPWVLMSLIPGMLIDREDVGGNEAGQQSAYFGHGSKDNDNTWSIDGANITDNSALGAAPAYVNVSSYEELQINYGANDILSQTGGVQLNLITKRGSNTYSGTFYLDVERKAWQADNVPQDLKDIGYTAAGINRLYLYGANFGGPIVKDKFWFYGSWGVQDIDSLTLAATSDETWLASSYLRLDYHITPSTRFNAFIQYDNKQKWGRYWYDATQQAADTVWNQDGPGYFYKGELEQMFGNLYLDAKVIYSDGGFYLHPTKEHTADGSGDYMTHIEYPDFYMQGNTDDYGTDRNQLNVSVYGNYFTEGVLGGDHEFKFGVDYVTSTVTTYDLYEGDLVLNYWGPDATLPTGENWEAWLYRDYIVNYSFARFGAFIQDTMTFGRLAVNLGLRYDQERSIVKNANIPASMWLPTYMPALSIDRFDEGIPWWKVFSPRMSLAYDLFGNGKDVIKFSVARYGSQSGFNIADFINPLGFTEIDLIWQDGYQDFVMGVADGRVQENELYGLDGTGALRDRNDPAYWLYSSNVPIPPTTDITAVNAFDPDYNSPLLDELTISYEKELFTDFAARLELFYKKYHNQMWIRFMDTDGNLEPDDNYYVAGTDPTVGYDYYGRTALYPYQYCTNHQDAYDRYLGAQIVWTKRLSNKWMMNGSFTYSDWKRFYKGEYVGLITDVFGSNVKMGLNNEEYFEGGVAAFESSGSGVEGIFVNSRWQFKLSGLYQLPYGITFSGVFQARDGYVKPTYVLVDMAELGINELYGSPEGGGKFGDERLPAFWVLNFRLEKVFNVTETSRVILSADAFNITNSAHSLKKETSIASPDFNQDLRILNPRVFRFGIRFAF
jgi:hypothetical protein